MSQTSEQQLDVCLIGASAGTGKTTRLVKEIVDAVLGIGYETPIPPTSIFLSTFTNKAADELLARSRERLIELGQYQAAQEILGGYIGTVNSICGRLLSDYAFEAGLSPQQNVISEETQDFIFSVATAPVLDAHADQFDDLAVRLSFDEPPNLNKKAYLRLPHWSEIVKQICELARCNNIGAHLFAEFAEHSWSEISNVLPPSPINVTAAQLDDLLCRELEHVVGRLNLTDDGTKKTREGVDKLCGFLSKAKKQRLCWADWAAISKIELGKASQDVISNLLLIANRHAEHPGLHDDIKTFITCVFQCAAEALEAYQNHKKTNGLIDFVDQEQLTLQLLDIPEVQSSLKERMKLAMIDEFQDTSPIQLALFLKIASIAEKSFWVGDVKQAIYDFRGTDPQLMQSALRELNQNERLSTSYRSRRELVEFSNDLFKAVLPQFGFREEDIVISTTRDSDKAHGAAIEIWRCEGKKLESCYESLAVGVREFLSRSPKVQIFDKSTACMRALKGSDVAVLCRMNDRAEGVAQALKDAGLKVAMITEGLLDTPECILALASLKYLVDKHNKLALAQLLHLKMNYDAETQDSWLREWLVFSGDDSVLLDDIEGFSEAREHINELSILQCFDQAINCGDVLETAAGWGNFRDRLANIDALRGVLLEYVKERELEGSPPTISGFIFHLSQLKEAKCPPCADEEAIQVLTYHSGKGLEWPVVVLSDLDKDSTPEVATDICCVAVESGNDHFDFLDPLRGRALHYWPWPYGKQKIGVYLDNAMIASPLYEKTAARLVQENIRLLYVGITRARDFLVFAPYCDRVGGGSGLQWVEELNGKGASIFRIPQKEEQRTIGVGNRNHPVVVRVYSGDPGAIATETNMKQVYLPNLRRRAELCPYLLRPSQQVARDMHAELSIQPAVIDIGSRIAITGKADMAVLGDCVHRFLAADHSMLEFHERLELADRLRSVWSVSQLSSASLIEMSDRLDAFIQSKFGKCRLLKECQLRCRVGDQRVHGIADLLVETDNARHLFDHKTFPGAQDKWVEKALSFAPQLTHYRRVLQQHDESKPVVGVYVHMPIIGKVIDLSGCCTDG